MMNLEMPKNNIPEEKVEDLESIWHGNHINKVRKLTLMVQQIQ